MRHVLVNFRGDLVDVDFRVICDEPDTNAFELEWTFADESMKDITVTAAEEQHIYDTCAQDATESEDIE